MGFSGFPRFYEIWLASEACQRWFAGLRLPNEDGAFLCSNCTMSHRPRGLTRDLGPFHPDIKCCTFHPYLPSFTVGALFVEVDEARLERQTLWTYLEQSRLDSIGAHSVKNTTSICETGKRFEDRCVFYQKGRCGIHGFRPSTCAAYVCRSNAGREGLQAWRRWESRFAEFEWSLAHEVAFDLGFTLDDVRERFKNLVDAEGFYRKSYEIARTIDIGQRFGLNA